MSRTLPEGQSEYFAYDAVGNRTTHTDFNGNTTTYLYDSVGREVSRSYSDGATTKRGRNYYSLARSKPTDWLI